MFQWSLENMSCWRSAIRGLAWIAKRNPKFSIHFLPRKDLRKVPDWAFPRSTVLSIKAADTFGYTANLQMGRPSRYIFPSWMLPQKRSLNQWFRRKGRLAPKRFWWLKMTRYCANLYARCFPQAVIRFTPRVMGPRHYKYWTGTTNLFICC